MKFIEEGKYRSGESRGTALVNGTQRMRAYTLRGGPYEDTGDGEVNVPAGGDGGGSGGGTTEEGGDWMEDVGSFFSWIEQGISDLDHIINIITGAPEEQGDPGWTDDTSLWGEGINVWQMQCPQVSDHFLDWVRANHEDYFANLDAMKSALALYAWIVGELPIFPGTCSYTANTAGVYDALGLDYQRMREAATSPQGFYRWNWYIRKHRIKYPGEAGYNGPFTDGGQLGNWLVQNGMSELVPPWGQGVPWEPGYAGGNASNPTNNTGTTSTPSDYKPAPPIKHWPPGMTWDGVKGMFVPISGGNVLTAPGHTAQPGADTGGGGGKPPKPKDDNGMLLLGGAALLGLFFMPKPTRTRSRR